MQESVNEPKGWSPDGTYTGRVKPHDPKFDDRRSNNPYPKLMPDLQKQFSAEVPFIMKAMRRLEHNIHEDLIHYDAGETVVFARLVWYIRNYKAIQEEMRTGVYDLPENLQWFLDNGNTEEAYV